MRNLLFFVLLNALMITSCNSPSSNAVKDSELESPNVAQEYEEAVYEEFMEAEVELQEYQRGEINSKLNNTEIVPILDVEIKPNKNYVFCSTMQLAWDEIKKKNPNFIRNNNQTKYVKKLNNQNYTGSVNEKDYIAVFGNKHEAEKEIHKQMMEKFNTSSNKLKLPDGNSFLAFSYLQKNLQFKYSFSKDILNFKNTKVKSFCTNEDPDIIRQVFLRYCAFSKKGEFRENDFVIELFTTRKNEQIILAKVKPKKTLKDTYNWISELISQKQIVDTFYSEIIQKESSVRFPFLLSEKEFVNIPVISFDVEKSYDELNGAILDDGRQIQQNTQKIDFCLNESGMILNSIVEVADSIGAFTIPPIIFNEPYLLFAKERKAKHPYLVVWVDNVGILHPE